MNRTTTTKTIGKFLLIFTLFLAAIPSPELSACIYDSDCAAGCRCQKTMYSIKYGVCRGCTKPGNEWDNGHKHPDPWHPKASYDPKFRYKLEGYGEMCHHDYECNAADPIRIPLHCVKEITGVRGLAGVCM